MPYKVKRIRLILLIYCKQTNTLPQALLHFTADQTTNARIEMD